VVTTFIEVADIIIRWLRNWMSKAYALSGLVLHCVESHRASPYAIADAPLGL
jgi:hypothetical protein